jgi:hypothetical protein
MKPEPVAMVESAEVSAAAKIDSIIGVTCINLVWNIGSQVRFFSGYGISDPFQAVFPEYVSNRRPWNSGPATRLAGHLKPKNVQAVCKRNRIPNRCYCVSDSSLG